MWLSDLFSLQMIKKLEQNGLKIKKGMIIIAISLWITLCLEFSHLQSIHFPQTLKKS